METKGQYKKMKHDLANIKMFIYKMNKILKLQMVKKVCFLSAKTHALVIIIVLVVNDTV